MGKVKRFIKRNSHSSFFKAMAGFGRALNRFYENRNHDIESNGELNILKKIAKFKPSIIIDGGANIGKYSLHISHICPDSKIYSLEPVDSTFTKLKFNTSKIDCIEPIMKGFDKENGSKEINVFETSTHSSLFDIQGISYKSEEKVKIDLIKGDDFLKEKNIDIVDFIKLDLEGAEYDTLLGFEESIKAGKIRAVQFEYGYINISTKKLLIDYYNFFERYDYIVGKIFPKSVEFRKYEFKYEDFLGPNYIAVKKSDKELINTLVGRI